MPSTLALFQPPPLQPAVAVPFARMQISSKAKPPMLAKDKGSLLIAAGLAYRAFDEAH